MGRISKLSGACPVGTRDRFHSTYLTRYQPHACLQGVFGNASFPTEVKGHRLIPLRGSGVKYGSSTVTLAADGPILIWRVWIGNDPAVRIRYARPLPVNVQDAFRLHYVHLQTAQQQRLWASFCLRLPVILEGEMARNLALGLLQVLGEWQSAAPSLRLVLLQPQREVHFPHELGLPLAMLPALLQTRIVPKLQEQPLAVMQGITPCGRPLQHHVLVVAAQFLILFHRVVLLPDLGEVPADDTNGQRQCTEAPHHGQAGHYLAGRCRGGVDVSVAHGGGSHYGPPEARGDGFKGTPLWFTVLYPFVSLPLRVPGALLCEVHESAKDDHAEE
mmetsp:Transcript_9471/g.22334  ORF Transcript_9471/g.22334 Transcript_9471/m.22334 type:complete len:331 (-) Transcript_9471:253-1245(-)